MRKLIVKKSVIGSIATVSAVICRIWFDGIFLRIYRGHSDNELFTVVMLIVSIIAGMIMLNKVMQIVIKVIGALLVGIGVGGATINSIELVCLFLNMNNFMVNVCQCMAFVILFVLSGAWAVKEVEEI